MLGSILIYLGLIICSLLYLLFCVSPKENTIMGRIRNFFFTTLPLITNQIGKKIFGKNFPYYTKRIKNYIFFENNSIIMIFYILVGPGGYLLFCYSVFYLHFEKISLPNLLISNTLVFYAFYNYYKACTTDPGTITEENFEEYTEKYSEYFKTKIYKKNNPCRTCKFQKPPRSKHCSLCKKCISKLDHHCIWIKGCVGEKNYKYFILFIVTHSLMCFYGFFLILDVVNIIIKRNNLWGQKFRRISTGEIVEPTYSSMFLFFISNYNNITFLGVLSGIMAVCLFFFALYHFSMIRKGVTTNEKYKVGWYLEKIQSRYERFKEELRRKEGNLTLKDSEESQEFLDDQKEVLKNIQDKYCRNDLIGNCKKLFFN